MYFKILFLCFFVLCGGASVKKNDFDNAINKENLELLRYDVDNIGVNVENFVVDVLKQFFEKKDHDVITESQIPTDDDTSETTTQGKITLLGVKNAPDPVKNSEQIQSQARNKRIHRNKRDVSRVNPNPQNCHPKTAREQQLEQQHIADLKDEVKKLRDLVVLLRDQRDILNILNSTNGSVIPKESLIKGLDHLHQKERELDDGKLANHEELHHIKVQIREAIHALNETKIILAKEQLREKNLETELMEQKNDITLLKYMVKVLYNSTFTNPTIVKNDTGVGNDTIVGSGLNFFGKPTEKPFLPQMTLTPTTTKDERIGEKQENSEKATTRESKSGPKNARASDLSDIVKIMEVMNRAEKKTDPTADELGKLLDAMKPEKKTTSTDLSELQELLNRRKKSEEMAQQLLALQKLMNNNGNNKALGKSDDIDLELKNLEEAINRLRPKEDGLDDGGASFQAMLNKIIANQGQGGARPNINSVNTNREFLPGYTCRIIQDDSSINEYDYSSDPFARPTGMFGGGFGQGPYGGYYGGGYPNGYGGYGGYGDNNGGYYGTGGGYNGNGAGYNGNSGGYNGNSGGYNGNGGGYNGNSGGYNGNSGGYNGNSGGYNANTAGYNGNAASYNGNAAGYNGNAGGYPGGYYGNNYAPPPPLPSPNNYNPGYNNQYQKGGNYNNNKGANDFFLYSQQNQYNKPAGGPSYGGGPAYPGNADQYTSNTQPAPNYAADYKNTNVEDLKNQIYSLQNVINDLNRPEYTQKPEDKQTIYDLDKQIGELKNVVNVLNTDNSYGPQGSNYAPPPSPPSAASSGDSPPYSPHKYRRRRSIDNNEIEDDKFLNNFFSKLVEEPKQEDKPRIDEVKTRLDALKKQLENNMQSQNGSPAPRSDIFSQQYSSPTTYQNSYYDNSYSVDQPSKILIKEEPKDIISKVILKIVDKLLGVLPFVLKKIFGFSLDELTSDYGGGYGYGNNYAIFKSIGVFGYLPLILLKLVDVFTYFMNALKKNKFLRTFVVPTGILGIAAGGILFLIWFLQSDDQYDYNKIDYNPPQQSYYPNTNYNSPPSSYNPPVYSRSYFENK